MIDTKTMQMLYQLPPFQVMCYMWLVECVGEHDAHNRTERVHRFTEEALELAQATGCTKEEAHQLVEYVFNRPVGVPVQEVGGVMNTLAALCTANFMDMDECARNELARCWYNIDKIRVKHAAKPKFGPLPGPSQPAAAGA